jgi:hypothetical protein
MPLGKITVQPRVDYFHAEAARVFAIHFANEEGSELRTFRINLRSAPVQRMALVEAE